MKYELVNKTTDEVVDTKDLSDIWLNGARTYFKEQKRLSDESFDELFKVRVRQKKELKLNRRIYKWWKEESTKLEDF